MAIEVVKLAPESFVAARHAAGAGWSGFIYLSCKTGLQPMTHFARFTMPEHVAIGAPVALSAHDRADLDLAKRRHDKCPTQFMLPYKRPGYWEQ